MRESNESVSMVRFSVIGQFSRARLMPVKSGRDEDACPNTAMLLAGMCSP